MKTLILVLHLLLFVHAETTIAHAQCHSATLVAEYTTVMVNGNHVSGAGIMIAVREPNIYIGTAKHVIADARDLASITAKFKSGEQVKISTNAIHKSLSKDLAFLVTENRELAQRLRQQLSWQILRSRSASGLQTGSGRAIIVGQGGGQDWIRSLEPERISNEKGADLIKIQSTTIQPGFLGGGVFDPNGLLIGIITSDASRPAEAMTIEAALSEARRLGLPVDLRESDLTPVPVFIAPLTGVPEDWDQLVRENIRHKLELQLGKKGFRPLECESTSAAIRVVRYHSGGTHVHDDRRRSCGAGEFVNPSG